MRSAFSARSSTSRSAPTRDDALAPRRRSACGVERREAERVPCTHQVAIARYRDEVVGYGSQRCSALQRVIASKPVTRGQCCGVMNHRIVDADLRDRLPEDRELVDRPLELLSGQSTGASGGRERRVHLDEGHVARDDLDGGVPCGCAARRRRLIDQKRHEGRTVEVGAHSVMPTALFEEVADCAVRLDRLGQRSSRRCRTTSDALPNELLES